MEPRQDYHAAGALAAEIGRQCSAATNVISRLSTSASSLMDGIFPAGSRRRRIVTCPAAILRQRAKPVTRIDDSIRALLDDMTETMYAAPGVGLAAPQVGISSRLIVVDISLFNWSKCLLQIVNPRITYAEGRSARNESCLSVPDASSYITRAERIVVEGYNEHGEPIKISAASYLATVLQHEIDHLDGVLFIDYIEGMNTRLV